MYIYIQYQYLGHIGGRRNFEASAHGFIGLHGGVDLEPINH